MSDHLVLPLEALPTFTSRAVFDGAVVVPDLAMDVLVRTVDVSTDAMPLGIEKPHLRRYWVWNGTAVQPR
jgi:hypothetical protein